MALASLVPFLGPTAALCVAPRGAGVAISRRMPPIVGQARDWHWDSGHFLDNPIAFISKNPDLFSEEMQAAAAYQLKVKSGELRLWGDLPEALDLCAKGAEYLRQKSAAADELAQIIVNASPETRLEFAQDATFEEKKAFFQKIAALPTSDNGMLAINNVASSMIAEGALPLMNQFEQDLQRVAAQVEEVNDALRELDSVYTTLFLSVRKVTKLASAAADVSVEVANNRRAQWDR